MKRVALLVAAVAATSASAQAAEDVEFKQSGEFRARYFNDNNSTALDGQGQQADTTARLKYNVSARKGEKLQAYFSVIHNSQFGTQNTVTGDYSTANERNLLLVNRAWGWWKATDSLSFKLGRFGIELADGAVFAENDWENVPTAHEGLQLAWDLDFAKLNLFAIKTNENTATNTPATGNPSSDPERNMYIASVDVKNLPEAIKMANVHFVQINKDQYTAAVGTLPAGYQNMQHVGFTVGGDAMNILYKATAAFQFGSFSKTDAADTKLDANMFDLMVGYSLPDVLGLKITGGFHQDSGDSDAADDKQQNYQSLYYDKHNYAGLMDVVRWGNLTYWNINASLVPAEDLEVGLGYYMFSRTKDTASATTVFGERFSTLAGAGTNKELGSEVDVYVTKSYENSFKIGARFGAFMPGTFLKDATPARDKTIMQGMLQASLAF